MNPAKFALRNRTTTIVLTLIVMIAGAASYFRLGRLEFPDFVIKTAVIMTPYPGASAGEVEQEVTDVLEEAIQLLGELDEVKSISQQGLSVIYAEIKDQYSGEELQQALKEATEPRWQGWLSLSVLMTRQEVGPIDLQRE